MIRIDLITGFLGSGKTTFIKKYARCLMNKGLRIGILENDYGAVNVDVMLLGELEGENCLLETVAGACDGDCRRRRFKTKLIALAMSGCERVIVEPSGIFDTDEFFDSLREEPLDRWYETGSVICIADAGLDGSLSEEERFILGSQCISAGTVLMSRTQLYSTQQCAAAVGIIKQTAAELGGNAENMDFILTPWDELTDEDMERLSCCGRGSSDYVKKFLGSKEHSTLYFMHNGLDRSSAKELADKLMHDRSCGSILRIKGFFCEDGQWYELNASQNSVSCTKISQGQDIIIVIGRELSKSRTERYFGRNTE